MRYPQFQKPPLGQQINWAHPLAKGLVGCWLMNEGAGNRIYDLSGNGNTGSLISTTKWVAGRSGSVLSFNGTSDYVDVGSNAIIKPVSAITVSAWVKFNSLTADIRAISDWHQSVIEDRWIFYEISATEIYWYVCNANGVGIGYVSYTPALNTWLHLVGVYNGSVVTLYVNGVSVGTPASLSGNMNAGSAVNTVRIGKQAETGWCFNGLIDDVRIYNRALSASEVQQLYVNPYAMFERRPVWMDYVAAAGRPEFYGSNLWSGSYPMFRGGNL